MTFLTGKALNWAITATAGCGFLLFGCKQKRQCWTNRANENTDLLFKMIKE